MDSENDNSDEEQVQEIRGETNIGDDNEENVFKILLATDIHLGYKENDPILGDDSFRAFEEILQVAVEKEVDFLLLGGDLFHDARPSPTCLLRCTDFLKKYCLGDRPISIEMLSDLNGNINQNPNEPLINYEDPNLNIQLPVLSIHGNHDDPIGQHHTSAMDVISSTGLVNYFGKWSNHTEVTVKPVLLKKGCTNLALYGLSHIKDERLGRLHLNGKISFTETPNDWFKMLVWHQNRCHRGTKNYICDDNLPDFLDLVMWGHEHDCRIIPEKMPNNVYVTQPGSSVATSLSQGESMAKHIGLLKIYKTTFDLQPIPLKTVRPFVYDEIILKYTKNSHEDPSQNAQNQVERAMYDILEKTKRMGQGNLLPLIRLNVKYENESQSFNLIRFGQNYIDKVANPADMIKSSSLVKKTRNKSIVPDLNGENEDNIIPSTLQDIIMDYFSKHNTIQCLSVAGLTQEVTKQFGTGDNSSVDSYLKNYAEELVKTLEEKQATEDEIDGIICHTKIKQDANKSSSRRILDDDEDEVMLVEDRSDGEEANTSVIKTTGRAKRANTTTSRGRGRGRGRGRAKAT